MNLNRIIRVLLQVENAKKYNSFVHFLQKIPLLGKKIPNRWYRADEVKIIMLVLKGLYLPFYVFGGTIFYVLFCAGVGFVLHKILPEYFALKEASASHLSLTLIFTFSVLLATIFHIKVIDKSDIEASQAVRIFRISPKDYLLAKEALDFSRGLLAKGLVFGLYFVFISRPFWWGLAFALFLAGLRLGIKMLTLPLYFRDRDRTEKFLNRVGIIAFFPAFAIGTALVFLGEAFSPQLVMSLPAGFAGLVIWLLAYRYLQKQSKLDVLVRSLLTHGALKEAATALDNIETVAVEVKEKDFDIDDQTVISGNLEGVAYLNAIFTKRLGRHLNKEIRWRLLIITGIGAVILGIRYFSDNRQPLISDDKIFWQSLFVTVMVGYLLYVGETYMKFCFYHLDRPLLKYHYYRRRDVILATLKERFKRSLQHNAPIFLLLNLIYSLLYVSFFDWKIAGLFMIVLGQVLSVTFFSLYFLYFYFLLQPFNDGMKSKSKLYNIMAGVVGYGGFQIFRLAKHISVAGVIGILIGLFLFILIGFLAVLRFAPKTFKLRP